MVEEKHAGSQEAKPESAERKARQKPKNGSKKPHVILASGITRLRNVKVKNST